MKEVMRKGDYYVEYLVANHKVEEIQRMLMTAMAMDANIDTKEANTALSNAILDRDKARARYNEMVAKMHAALDGMRQWAGLDLFKVCLVDFLELAVNIAPIEEEKVDVVENLHS